MKSRDDSAWQPSRHRVRAITDAILNELARSAPQHTMTRETANTLAIAAMKADRAVLLSTNPGRKHGDA